MKDAHQGPQVKAIQEDLKLAVANTTDAANHRNQREKKNDESGHFNVNTSLGGKNRNIMYGCEF